ncbi:TPA: hypothetical protein MH198_21460 [Klebsiella pneumoniae]|nr:hypothetical protein [Klebsiella pneumoniae]
MLSLELALFGIKATCIHSEPFRTDFLDAISVMFGDVINVCFWHRTAYQYYKNIQIYIIPLNIPD